MINWLELKKEFEAGIRAGHAHRVRGRLATLRLDEIPREEYVTFSGFARRAGAPAWALRLLKPVVLPMSHGGPNQAPATPAEISSYVLALAATGALSEARLLAKKIEHLHQPETLQACAYVSIFGWDYAKAVSLLKRYLKLSGLSEFQVALAQVNLASSHEFLGHSVKARELADLVIPQAHRQGWSLLERDALLLASQLHISQGEWRAARQQIDRAMSVSQTQGLDPLLAEKWLAIVALNESPKHASSLSMVEGIKKKAQLARRWEIARDCDFHRARVIRQKADLDRIYSGTPFLSFRKRLLKETQDFWSPPSEYLWQPHGSKGDLVIDVDTGTVKGGPADAFIEDDLRLRLLQILSSDFYRPFKLGSLFAELYPEKHFDVINSSHTAANVIKRLRESFQNSNLPVSVSCRAQLYSLEVRGAVAFRLHLSERGASEPKPNPIEILRKLWPYQVFTASQVEQALSVPRLKAKALLRDAVAHGVVCSIGNTKSRLYRFKSKAEKKSA